MIVEPIAEQLRIQLYVHTRPELAVENYAAQQQALLSQTIVRVNLLTCWCICKAIYEAALFGMGEGGALRLTTGTGRSQFSQR